MKLLCKSMYEIGTINIMSFFSADFQFTQVQYPSLHPTNNVGRVYPEFFPSFNFV